MRALQSTQIGLSSRSGNALLALAGALLLSALACSSLTGGAELLVDAPGVAPITLLAPETGAGLQPLLSWEAVDGAHTYQVSVYTPDEEPYWAWTGAETSVYLGGGHTPPPEDSAGPALRAGMWWAVLALDADGRIVGSSVLQPISP